MAQAPRFETCQQVMVFRLRGPDFLLVIAESPQFVIRQGIIIFAHVGQHSKQALANTWTGFREGPAPASRYKRQEEPALPPDGPFEQVALLQSLDFCLKVRWNRTTQRCGAQLVQLRLADEVEITRPHGRWVEERCLEAWRHS